MCCTSRVSKPDSCPCVHLLRRVRRFPLPRTPSKSLLINAVWHLAIWKAIYIGLTLPVLACIHTLKVLPPHYKPGMSVWDTSPTLLLSNTVPLPLLAWISKALPRHLLCVMGVNDEQHRNGYSHQGERVCEE